MQSPTIESFNLTKKFYDFTAVDNVSLRLHNYTYFIIGPNGSGKSTLIKLILGLERPTKGWVKVLGFDPFFHHEKINKELGYLKEKPNFPKNINGLQLLNHIAKTKGVKLEESLIKEEIVDLGFLNKKIGECSAGMVQRLGILQALVGNPKIIIMDEPTTNLDPTGKEQFIALIRKLKKEERTIIISSHVLEELSQLCDFVVAMHNGKVVAFEGVTKFIKDYSSDGTLRSAYENAIMLRRNK